MTFSPLIPCTFSIIKGYQFPAVNAILATCAAEVYTRVDCEFYLMNGKVKLLFNLITLSNPNSLMRSHLVFAFVCLLFSQSFAVMFMHVTKC